MVTVTNPAKKINTKIVFYYKIISLLIILFLCMKTSSAETGKYKEAESADLTLKAKSELQNYNYKKAYKLLEQAIILDPSNDEAKDIYVKLSEMAGELSEESSSQTVPVKKIRQKKKKSFKEAEQVITTEQPESSGELYLKGGFIYTYGRSNFIPEINSNVQMPGVNIELIYYTGFSDGRLGFSSDYRVNPLITNGDSQIDFMLHRANLFILYREKFFETSDNNVLILGVRTGYHYFMLQNKKDQGAYYFTGAFCPAAGFFISDPVFSRIFPNSFVSEFGIEAGADYMPVYQESKLVNIYDYRIAITYRFEIAEISIGWKSYNFNNGNIRESFSDIELTALYKF